MLDDRGEKRWQMTNARFAELMKNQELSLTAQEIAGGWRFCGCEWDGLLVNTNDTEGEGQFCTCWKKDE